MVFVVEDVSRAAVNDFDAYHRGDGFKRPANGFPVRECKCRLSQDSGATCGRGDEIAVPEFAEFVFYAWGAVPVSILEPLADFLKSKLDLFSHFLLYLRVTNHMDKHGIEQRSLFAKLPNGACQEKG